MKKFISALSSFAIAATAMGSCMVFPTAVAADVDETIVALRSSGESTIKADAGTTIPVEVYIPQSSGFNRFQLKFAIGKDGNLDDTKGQGTVVDRNGKEIPNYKDAFGFYGIKMVAKGDKIGSKQTNFTYPNCLESGYATEYSSDAGNLPSIAMFNTDDGAWSVLYQADTEIKKSMDVDSYGAWVDKGGIIDEDFDYESYTPATKWSENDSWAYQYTFTKFELQLPATLADGTYVLDLYKDEYINCHPGSLFRDDNSVVPDDEREVGQTNFKGVGGDQKWSCKPLTIMVGSGTQATTEPPVVTTEAPVTTTVAPVITTEPPVVTTVDGTDTVPVPATTAPVDTTPAVTVTQPPANAIIYNLVPHSGEYTDAQTNGLVNNVYNAQPGEDLQIDWTIKNDQGTAGLQMSFDFTQVEYISGKRGGAYRIAPTYSDFNNTANMQKGEVIYTWAQSDENFAEDGKIIYSFKVKVPESGGTYIVGLNANP
ncbi:MAG: hypothetical protein J5722_01470, partial [Oscillospiraceae bacterium]|nr:hypothetical protein [Oscillospiraceae bacterium]